MKECRPETWEQLQFELFEDSWNERIGRFRSNYAFRGVNLASYELQNGLMRMGEPYPKMEQNLIKQFQKYAYENTLKFTSEWHWLSVAQHHGLPTRLLDWTYSPFIALHFATSEVDDYEKDGAVWMVNYVDTHSLLQDKHRKELKKFGANIFSMEMLSASIQDLEELDSYHSDLFDCAVFFEPPTLDERIVNQFAYFSVLSDPQLTMDAWLGKPMIKEKVKHKKVVIPSKLKWEIRDKLDQSNINERILMTGLDGLCAWLKRHYTPAKSPAGKA